MSPLPYERVRVVKHKDARARVVEQVVEKSHTGSELDDLAARGGDVRQSELLQAVSPTVMGLDPQRRDVAAGAAPQEAGGIRLVSGHPEGPVVLQHLAVTMACPHPFERA